MMEDMGAAACAGFGAAEEMWDAAVEAPDAEAEAAPGLPQNVACGFPALRSSERVSQHSVCLELPVWQSQAWLL